jgi:hypothetical protein
MSLYLKEFTVPQLFQDVYDMFPRWAVSAVLKIYDEREGGYDTVDHSAIENVLGQFPDATEAMKDRLKHYGIWASR